LNVAEIHAVLGKEAALAVVEEAHVALSRLEDGTFDAVVLYASGPGSEWPGLCQRLRQNTQLYNLPVLVIAGPAVYRDVEPIYEAGATDVLRADTPVDEIAFRMLSLVRMQRYRRAMQKVYREIRDERTSDDLTGLYNCEFLTAHLAAEIRDAAQGDKALSLGYLETSDLDRVEESLGEAARRRIVQQLGGMVGALVRGEDLPARYAEDDICVVLPNTDETAARQVLRRIAAIVNVTTLDIPDIEAPIGVHVRSGCASALPDETAEALIDRARTDLSD
jgi:two-component system cell cycle response regulator PopA